MGHVTATDRPPDPKRYAMVERLVRKGYPDREIVHQVRDKFECSANTVLTDLRRLWRELREENAEKVQHRRNVMRIQLETLQVESREVADTARGGFTIDGKEGPVLIQDMKTASIALSASERIFGRLAQLDGIAESDRIKAEILKQKLLEQQGFTEEQLAEMIRVEVASAVETMPDEEFAKLVERRGVR